MTKDYTQQLDNLLTDNLCEKILNQVIQITIASIGPEVTWDHFEHHLLSYINADAEIFENLQAELLTAFEKSETSLVILDNNLVKLTFNNPQTARAFYEFTQHIFPIIKSEYPKLNNNEILLTEDQLFFCRRGAKLKTGELPSDFLDDYFLKTLRADQYDFSDKFLKGLIPQTNGTRHLQNLRPAGRLPYTIAGDGTVISRITRVSADNSHKEGFTQIQSCTLLDHKALTPAFGFDKERNPKLYGLVTHRNDLMISRLLLKDGGTVYRPFEAEGTQPGERKASNLKDPAKPQLFHPKEYEKFKSENIKARRKKQYTNEILARLRFNIYRGMVCICADNHEARLLAHDFSEEILEHYAEYAKGKGIQLNPKFKIPILFYVKKPDLSYSTSFINRITGDEALHRIFKLTHKMRRDDIKRSQAINAFSFNRQQQYQRNNYEFLLGLERLTPELLLEATENNIPLAADMMEQGYTRMLLRLLRPSRKRTAPFTQEKPSLTEIVFNAIIDKENIIVFEKIIPQLFIAEEFLVAKKLADHAKVKLEDLKYEDISLTDYVLTRGNPRQVYQMGLDDMLIKAAYRNYWVTIRLCLKEFDNISNNTIDTLFSRACHGRYLAFNEPDIVFLLKKRNVSNHIIEKEINLALITNKWDLMELLINNYNENNNKIDLGRLLFLTVQKKQPKIAAIILTKNPTNRWRRYSGQNYLLNSTVLYAIEHEFNDLLPQLIDFEKTYQDEYSDARRGLAIDLAHAKKNTTAIANFSKNAFSDEFILLSDNSLSICFYVFEAFFANQPEIAEYRLRSLLKQCDLSMNNCKNIIQTLMLFHEFFQPALRHFIVFIEYHRVSQVGEETFMELIYIQAFFDCLATLGLRYNDVFLTRTLQNILHLNFNVKKEEIEEMIIESSLKLISSANIETILLLFKTSDFPITWKDCIFENLTKATTSNRSKHDYNEHSALLLYLILTIQKMRPDFTLKKDHLQTAFKHAVATSNTTLTHYLISETNLTELLNEDLSTIAFVYSGTRYFSYLMRNYSFTFHQKDFSAHEEGIMRNHSGFLSYWKAIVLLQELTKTQYRNKFAHWDYFFLWSYCSSTEVWDHQEAASHKLFAVILNHNIIKHFSLITLTMVLLYRFRDVSLNAWPNLQAILLNEYIKPCVNYHSTEILGEKKEPLDSNKNLLDTLNNYFDGTEKIPDADRTNQTYQIVLSLLSQGTTQSWGAYFFRRSMYSGFSNGLYNYLKKIDNLLSQHLTVPLKHDSEDAEELHRTIDDIYSNQKIGLR